MLGIVFGTICLIALFAVMRRERYRRYARAHGYLHPYGYGPWDRPWHPHRAHRGHGHGHGHGHGYGHGQYSLRPRERVRALLARLDTSPGQDRAISAAYDTLRERVHAPYDALRSAERALARAVSGDVLDARALDAALAQHQELEAEARAALAQFLRTLHETLEPRQRKELSEIIEQGLFAHGLFGRGHGWMD